MFVSSRIQIGTPFLFISIRSHYIYQLQCYRTSFTFYLFCKAHKHLQYVELLFSSFCWQKPALFVIIDKSIIAKEALVLQCLCVADSLQTSVFVNIYLIHTRAFPFRKCEGTNLTASQ